MMAKTTAATMITSVGFWTPCLHDSRLLVSRAGWFIVQAACPGRPIGRGSRNTRR